MSRRFLRADNVVLLFRHVAQGTDFKRNVALHGIH